MTNAESLASVVTALGGTPAGTTNAELIQEIAALLGSEASAATNAEALSALATALTGKIVGTGQTKTATPKTTKVTVTPDAGKVLTKVEVSAVTSSIDANIVAGNIKKDVVILGVTGSYEGGGGAWRLWDGEETLADNSGNALCDVYFVIEAGGASVSGMIPKGEMITPSDYIELIAGGYSGSSIVCGEVYIGAEDQSGSMTTIPLTPGTPPVAGTVVQTDIVPTLGTNLQVYLRASNGLPAGQRARPRHGPDALTRPHEVRRGPGEADMGPPPRPFFNQDRHRACGGSSCPLPGAVLLHHRPRQPALIVHVGYLLPRMTIVIYTCNTYIPLREVRGPQERKDMNGNADWQKEMDAQAERNARKAQEAAEDIVERMRALQIALALMGRAEDARLVGQALEPMKEVAGVQRWQPSTPTQGWSASAF